MGFVLATVTLLFGAVYQVNYMTALMFLARAGVPGATSFDPVEPYIVAVFAIGAAIMLASMKSQRAAT
jgi:hypothetical protein